MGKARILVVDDNSTNIKLVTDLLEWNGFEVIPAMDAEAAIAAISLRHPDLILMDIALPGMDGLTLTRRLKADAVTKAIPIIALTAFAMKGDESKAFDAGCDGYISKPIDTRALPNQILGFISAR
jgi:CheY-like chemotaxis protein